MSCVVKWCKNRSDRKKKNPGITFHRFSKENEVWRNDWIEIIRNCNGESDWIPNKYSVICSLHFEANDLYTTKGGLRRVVTYAVPQKFLFEPTHMTEEQSAAVPYIPIASQESTSVNVPALEHLGSSTMILKREYLPAELNISNASRESISVIGIKTLEHPDTSTLVFREEQPDELNISSIKQEVGKVLVFSFFFEPAHMAEEEPAAVPYIPIASQESTSVTVPVLEHSGSSTMILKREYLPAELNISNASRESISVIETKAFEQPDTSTLVFQEEQPTEPNISSIKQEGTSVTVPALEHPGSSTMILKREYLPAELNISNASRESISVIGTQAFDQPDTSTLVFREEQPTELNISSIKQENSSEIGTDEEQVLSILYTPRKRSLKQILIKKQEIIKKQKREIKTLKQKVKRLQNRNKSVKEILKSLKHNNYVDTETFNRLKENMVTVDLFNNLNRKKLKKNIKYTPAIKKFCLTLNYYAPKAYDYVRQTFDTCLPHRKTLSKWYGHIKGDPGFTEESFQVLSSIYIKDETD